MSVASEAAHVRAVLVEVRLARRPRLFYEHARKKMELSEGGELRSFSNSPDRENINAHDDLVKF